MTLIAKSVISKQYWIVQQNNQKVGNIQAVDNGYRVTIKNKIAEYKTIPMLSRKENVEFVELPKVKKQSTNLVHGYEVPGKMFNALWDVKHKLPLFTKSAKSKSWFAAGWYMVKQHRNWKLVQNPKLIALERYKYQGPFHTKEEANDKSVS